MPDLSLPKLCGTELKRIYPVSVDDMTSAAPKSWALSGDLLEMYLDDSQRYTSIGYHGIKQIFKRGHAGATKEHIRRWRSQHLRWLKLSISTLNDGPSIIATKASCFHLRNDSLSTMVDIHRPSLYQHADLNRHKPIHQVSDNDRWRLQRCLRNRMPTIRLSRPLPRKLRSSHSDPLRRKHRRLVSCEKRHWINSRKCARRRGFYTARVSEDTAGTV